MTINHLFISLFILISEVAVPVKLTAQDITTSSSPTYSFDHFIIPAFRIGPVKLNGSVKEIVSIIGNPAKIKREKIKDRISGHTYDMVYYTYDFTHIDRYSVSFNWWDKDISPAVAGWVTTDSKSWLTEKGVHVGSSADDVEKAYGKPDAVAKVKKDLYMVYYSGIIFVVKDRNSPISKIIVLDTESARIFR